MFALWWEEERATWEVREDTLKQLRGTATWEDTLKQWQSWHTTVSWHFKDRRHILGNAKKEKGGFIKFSISDALSSSSDLFMIFIHYLFSALSWLRWKLASTRIQTFSWSVATSFFIFHGHKQPTFSFSWSVANYFLNPIWSCSGLPDAKRKSSDDRQVVDGSRKSPRRRLRPLLHTSNQVDF